METEMTYCDGLETAPALLLPRNGTGMPCGRADAIQLAGRRQPAHVNADGPSLLHATPLSTPLSPPFFVLRLSPDITFHSPLFGQVVEKQRPMLARRIKSLPLEQ